MIDRKKLLKKLGNQITSLRKEKGLSQTELAYQCNLDRQALHRIEAGKTNPTTVTLANISDTLSVPLKKLFDFE